MSKRHGEAIQRVWGGCLGGMGGCLVGMGRLSKGYRIISKGHGDAI